MTSQEADAEFAKIFAEYQKMAERDRQFKAELIKDRMRRTVSDGYWVSRPPFGYSSNSKTGIIRINRQGRALQEVIRNFLDDGSKEQFLCGIVLLLNSRYSGRRAVLNIVTNPIYRGKLVYDGKIYDGKHEPLVGEDEYKAILGKLMM